jgi:hypothetical protein
MTSNKPNASKPAIGPRLYTGRQWRRLADSGRRAGSHADRWEHMRGLRGEDHLLTGWEVL